MLEKIDQGLYRRKISLKTDKYLDSHRFASTPYFPFVMGMEFFCQVCSEMTVVTESILFSDFQVHAPMMFRKDREKIVLIKVENIDEFKFIQICDQDHNVYMSGNLAPRIIPRKSNRTSFNINDYQTAVFEKLSDDFVYQQLFPHGPHFHNQFEIIVCNDEELIVLQTGFNNTLDYIQNEKIDGLTCNPAMLDGIMQMCSYFSVRQHKCFLLPVAASACFIKHSIEDKIESVYVVIKRASIVSFDAFVYCTLTKDIVVEFRNLAFCPLKKNTP